MDAIFDLPSPSSPPQPPRTVLRRLTDKEADDHTASIHPWTSWIVQKKAVLLSLPLSSLLPIADAFFSEISGHHHTITAPCGPRVPRAFKRLRQLLCHLPPVGSPHFGQKYLEFQRASERARSSHKKSSLTRVHRFIVQHRWLKRSITDCLDLDKQSNIILRTDKGHITSDQHQVAKILGETQITLGGTPRFQPDDEFLESLLPQVPSAPEETRHYVRIIVTALTARVACLFTLQNFRSRLNAFRSALFLPSHF